MHTFLTQSIYIKIPCTYVLQITFPMCLLFYHYIWQSCSEVVVTLVIYIINQIMNGCRLTDSVLYFIQYATLKYIPTTQSIKVCSIDVYLLLDSYLHSNTITSIKPGTLNNLTNLQLL